MESISEQASQMRLENENVERQGVEVKISSEFTHLKFNTTAELLTLITIKAQVCETPESQRAPLDLVSVLDISGSMTGEKIEMVKRSMVFAISQLKSDDRLAIVLFESKVSVLFDLKFMDSKNKRDATELVNSIDTRDMTNLSGGLFEGLDLLIKDQAITNTTNNSNEERKAVTSILLFTDGEANVGLTKVEQIIPEMKIKTDQILRPTNIFCFGYGTDHVVEMLKGLADSSNGMYYYVENEDHIASAFGDCIGGLLSMAAQNLQLTLKTSEESVKIKKILGSQKKFKETYFNNTSASASSDIEVNSNIYQRELGDIYSEEERNIICLLEVSNIETSSEQLRELLVCELKGFDVLKGDTLNQSVNCSIVRNHESKIDQEKSVRINVHRNRLTTIQALKNARSLADNDQLDQARKVLNEAITELQSSSSVCDQLTRALLEDLNECLRDMETRNTYHGSGKMKMAMYETCHMTERGCHSRQTYSNSKKMSEREKYSSFTK